MTQELRCVPPDGIVTGWDFSTSGMKCLAFDVEGNTVADIRLPTDLWQRGGACELNLMQIEGQARASVRAIVAELKRLGRLEHWIAGGISATHHTAGRVDARYLQVRRAICWNDQTLQKYHAVGLERLGGQEKVRQLIGGPWAVRYTLSHLVKDEAKLEPEDWRRTALVLSHGSLAAGFLTGNFNTCSISSAASTGIMDLRTGAWRPEMLNALATPEYRKLAEAQLPKIVDHFEPIGPLGWRIADQAGLEDQEQRPLIFPTSDDQQAGLVGGGAVEAGQMAIILGSSAVVNSSSAKLPATDKLDAMRLNWGPYLWMRCYTNGAQFINKVVGNDPDWAELERLGRAVPPGCNGMSVLPFVFAEPSIGVLSPRFEWEPRQPQDDGVRFRAALEALAFLIALGVKQHEEAGQKIKRITVSGGLSRSALACEILATVLDRPLQLLRSDEGPALGAAVTALAAMETYLRRQPKQEEDGSSAAAPDDDNLFTVADAVGHMVRFRPQQAKPNASWRGHYEKALRIFEKKIRSQ